MSFCQITVFLSFCNDITLIKCQKFQMVTHSLTHSPTNVKVGRAVKKLNKLQRTKQENFSCQFQGPRFDIHGNCYVLYHIHANTLKRALFADSCLVWCVAEPMDRKVLTTEKGGAATSTTIRTGSRIQYCNSAAARGFQGNETFVDCNLDTAELCLI